MALELETKLRVTIQKFMVVIDNFAEGTAFLRTTSSFRIFKKFTQGNSEWVKNEKLGALISFMAGNACVGDKNSASMKKV